MSETLEDIGDADWEICGKQLRAGVMVQAALLVVAFPTSWLYARFGKTTSGRGALHLMKNKYLGDAISFPEGASIVAANALFKLGNALFSAFTVYLWVHKTYERKVENNFAVAENVMCVYFMLNFLICFLKHEFKPPYIFNVEALIEVLSVVPLLLQDVDGYRTWLSWSFIRVHCVYKELVHISTLGYNPLHLSDISIQMYLSLFKFLDMLVLMSGAMLIFEVLGPIEKLEDKFFDCDMGEVSFLAMVYFIVTTISTVGYGDLSPKTLLGRFLAIGSIMYGVVFFSVETGVILKLQKMEESGMGRFTPSKGKCAHAIVFGGAVDTCSINLLKAFLDELCNPATTGSDKLTPDVVLMGCGDVTPDMREMLKTPMFKKAVTYLHGSPLKEEDLERCAITKCDMYFILPNMNVANNHMDKEDENNIIIAAAIIKAFPTVPMRLMLLRPQNRKLALKFNVKRSFCYSLNEFKANLIAQSFRCPGMPTVLLSLARLPAPLDENLIAAEPWVEEFNNGCENQLYGTLLDDRFVGLDFCSAAALAYKTNGSLLIACQCGGRVVTNPGSKVKIVKETVVFLLSRSRLHVQALSADASWRSVFRKNRFEPVQQKVVRKHGDIMNQVRHHNDNSLSGPLHGVEKEEIGSLDVVYSNPGSDVATPVHFTP
eukprot:gene17646-21022_t